MRMPFAEFITGGDLKFIFVFVFFMVFAIYHFFKKLQAKKAENSQKLLPYHNSKIKIAAFWILISSILSLLLGLMHSFYFIGKSGGGSPSLIFQGVSYALITPVLGISLFMICSILKSIFNLKSSNYKNAKQVYTLFFALMASSIGFSQSLASEAADLREAGNLAAAIEKYKGEYYKSPKDEKNTYNLACAYALTIQLDSAYHYLNVALKTNSSLWVLADSDFYALTEDARWSEIEDAQIKKFQQEEGVLEQPIYTKKLLRIIMKDQALDYYIDQAKAAYMEKGYVPQWYYPLGWTKQKIVAENYAKMQKLLANYGWPKYSTVGKLAADAPLLVINHHDDNGVRKKYLAQIKQACLDGEGSCMEFAKIQDRILVDENKPQIYGMQFRYNPERQLEPFPIENPEQVDQRRSAIGLEPLKDYLKRKIDYDWTVIQTK